MTRVLQISTMRRSILCQYSIVYHPPFSIVKFSLRNVMHIIQNSFVTSRDFHEGIRGHNTRAEHMHSTNRGIRATGMVPRPAHPVRAIWPPKSPQPKPAFKQTKYSIIKLALISLIKRKLHSNKHMNCVNNS